MKTISEQEIQNIMKKAPQYSRDQIISGLKEKGYTIASEPVSSPISTPSVTRGVNAGAPIATPTPAPKPGIVDTLKTAAKVGAKTAASTLASVFVGPLAGLAVKNPKQAADTASLVAGSTAQLVSKPFVSMRAGVTGDFRPVDVPVAGSVRPYESPLSPATQYISEAAGQKITPEEAEAAKKIARSNLWEAAGTTLGTALEIGTLGAESVLKRPITKAAEKLYQSALKPTTELLEKGVVQTGLAERVWLTKGGVEKAAQKIDDLEEALGATIDAAKGQGLKVPTNGLREFVDPIRKWFETVDVGGSKAAQEYIDTTLKDFTKKYGKNIPIEEAQKLKTNTMRFLRNAYGELSSVQKETQKQIARFLKEGIVEKAPAAGEINARLKNLYALDESLEKASRRIGNLNLLGFGTDVAAGLGGAKAAIITKAVKLLDAASVKSGAAIGLNELSKLVGAGGNIPVTVLLNYVLGQVRPRKQPENNQ